MVKELLLTADEAEREVERPNALNAAKDCLYFTMQTRLFPYGRAGS